MKLDPIEAGSLWQYRLWSFQGRDTKLERFVAKNQLMSNEIIWCNGEVSKSEFDFQNQFSMSKIIRIFSLKIMILGAHFSLHIDIF